MAACSYLSLNFSIKDSVLNILSEQTDCFYDCNTTTVCESESEKDCDDSVMMVMFSNLLLCWSDFLIPEDTSFFNSVFDDDFWVGVNDF